MFEFIRAMAEFASIGVSAVATRWVSLLYKDGEGASAGVAYRREFYVDDAGTLHVVLAFIDPVNGDLIASKSKHWTISADRFAVAMGGPDDLAVGQSRRNWVDMGSVVAIDLIVNADDETENGNPATLTFRSVDGKGNDRWDTYDGHFAPSPATDEA